MRREIGSGCLALMALTGSATGAPSLCQPNEQTLFSCPLAQSHKTVSLCIKPEGENTTAGRYVIGTAKHPDLVYPAAGQAGSFHDTLLRFAGANTTGTFSFVNGTYEYILYQNSFEGDNSAGIVVDRSGGTHPVAHFKCRSKLDPAEDWTVANKVHGWSSDSSSRIDQILRKAP